MNKDLLFQKYVNLPSKARQELIDFMESLVTRYSKKEIPAKNGFSFDWEGDLSELNHSSVDLQHQANQWR